MNKLLSLVEFLKNYLSVRARSRTTNAKSLYFANAISTSRLSQVWKPLLEVTLSIILKVLTSLLFSFLFIILFPIIAVEERNPLPFYYLTAKPFKIKINLKTYKLCRVKLNDVIQYKNIELIDCYDLDRKVSETVKLIQEKNSKKNELNLMFVDENKKIVNPELHTSEGVYTVKSILYFKKNKAHHIELMDKTGGYYYFTYDPGQVGVGE